jgi:hypothetical protein
VYRLGVVTVTDTVTITVIATTTTATTVIIIITFTITTILKRITLYDHHSINREQNKNKKKGILLRRFDIYAI